ncbi:putative 3'-5' exonuclease domain-containing protein [Neospora caninum Liverpool]|uniref:Putative 3'-5' exonuclease domain-containing protein n=1 Tax=Neospora caninum (strain Liverpool) TaxID=572307 RepID=F0VR69_NEOCL|nr:putative 3'-5' exonuclease domain-containing protein [Neospora caninum Liverpool]CBZ56217.1 putative 3'-5' exonuclease domain-containing protein [Neospora caninum Liverpool]|eukprot:XP_003886242.1 putative 3'-5' exonuclease domain-containing protein [Neospora caninum Liverpool]
MVCSDAPTLASSSVACVWQLGALGGLPPGLVSLLVRPDVQKATQGATGEVEALQREFGVAAKNFLCLHAAAIALGCATNSRSLQALCGVFLRSYLDKSLQLSTWSRDALSPEQCMYAATDAYVSRQVLFGMRDRINQKDVMRLVEAQATLQARATRNEGEEQGDKAASGSFAPFQNAQVATEDAGIKRKAGAEENPTAHGFHAERDNPVDTGDLGSRVNCKDANDSGDGDKTEQVTVRGSIRSLKERRDVQGEPQGESSREGGSRGNSQEDPETFEHDSTLHSGRTDTLELGGQRESRGCGSEKKSIIVRSKLRGPVSDREVFVATMSRQGAELEKERPVNSPLSEPSPPQKRRSGETVSQQPSDVSVANSHDRENSCIVEKGRDGEERGMGKQISHGPHAGHAWLLLKETCVERGWRLECTRLESCRTGFRSVFSVNTGVSGVFVAKSSEAHTTLREAQNDAAAQMLSLLSELGRKQSV